MVSSRLKEICIPVASHAAYHKRKLRVATIGAGFSGLIFAHKIQHEQPELQEFIEHVIFEANDDIGGTWKVNTYPGVQCDVPAHIYVRKQTGDLPDCPYFCGYDEMLLLSGHH